MKKLVKPRTVAKKMVQVRRSARVANYPAPVYAEISLPRLLSLRKLEFCWKFCRSYGVARSIDLSNNVIATDEVMEYTIQEAKNLNSKLNDEGFPTLIRPMPPSHVTGGFWLGLPRDFCRASLPRGDGMVTLVYEEEDEYAVVYLACKRGLSGVWKGFCEAHQLVDRDAVIFQVINRTILK
ncbi:hypothetical protein RDABS01_013597, partial [Bienertia sinuspersici]